jgi:hypothetical protein
MSPTDEQAKTLRAAVRRFEALEQSGSVALDEEARAIDTAIQALASDPEFGLLRLWNALRSFTHPLAGRTLSFLLAQRQAPRPRFAELVAIDLMGRRRTDDSSTLLNLATTAAAWLRSKPAPPQALFAELPQLLLRALRQPELVRNAALDLLVTIADVDGFGNMAAHTNGALIAEVRADDSAESADDAAFIASRAEGKGLEKTEFHEAVFRALQSLYEDLRGSESAIGEQGVFVTAQRYLQWRVLESRARATSSRVGFPVKTIRVADNSRSPAFNVVQAVLDTWMKFFETACDALELSPVVRPLEAGPGSFVINATLEEVTNPERVLERLRQLVEVGANNIGDVLATETIDAKTYRNLLEVLAEHRATLEVTIVDAEQEAISPLVPLSITFATAKAVLPPVRQVAATTRLTSDQIPQADDLSRVFGLIQLLNQGEAITPQSLDVSLRQVNYYKHAARVLGLLSAENILTSAGRQVARLNDQQRRMSTAVLFEESDCGSAWLRWSNVATLAEVDPDSANSFITHVVPGLSAVTAGRRAQTLAAWQRELAPFHYTRWRVDDR